MIKKALGEDRTSQASPVLKEVLRVHMLSLWFCAGHQATKMLELAVRAGLQAWGHVRVPGSCRRVCAPFVQTSTGRKLGLGSGFMRASRLL